MVDRILDAHDLCPWRYSCDDIMLDDKSNFSVVIKVANQLTLNQEDCSPSAPEHFKSVEFSLAGHRRGSQRDSKSKEDSTHRYLL